MKRSKEVTTTIKMNKMPLHKAFLILFKKICMARFCCNDSERVHKSKLFFFLGSEIFFNCSKIHMYISHLNHFKCTVVTISTFILLCNHHLNLSPEIFYLLKSKL